MNLVYTLVAALPLGFFIASRGPAVLTYLAIGGHVLGFQHVGVLLSWFADEPPVAFGPSPTTLPVAYDSSELVGYGVVNLLITVAGVGLVLLGHRIGRGRRSRRAGQVAGRPADEPHPRILGA